MLTTGYYVSISGFSKNKKKIKKLGIACSDEYFVAKGYAHFFLAHASIK